MNLASLVQKPNLSHTPTPPAGFPQFDPNNPMAAVMAMQALMGGMMPQQPSGFGQAQSPQGWRDAPPLKKRGERCRDYDNKGFCVRGSACPYEHGNDHLVIPAQSEGTEPLLSELLIADCTHLEYDPNNSSMTNSGNRNPNNRSSPPHSRPRGGRSNDQAFRTSPHPSRRGGPKRAPFSDYKPNFDRARTTIVAESIPEENFSEEQVRGFFEQFGEVAEVTMQAYKRLAIVKFEEFWAAKTAYNSPKSVFENRFVKVYWYNPDNSPAAPSSAAGGAEKNGRNGVNGNALFVKKDEDGGEEDEGMQIDTEEFRKQQEEVQRRLEGKKRKLAEAEAAKQELDAKVKAQQEERRKLMARLTAKTAGRSPSSPPSAAAAEHGDDSKGADADTTGTPIMSEEKKKASEALRKKLAELEQEAQNMGIDPDVNESSYFSQPAGGRGYPAGRGGGRGYGSSHRGGRAGYFPRGGGSGYDAYYSPRGRGAGRSAYAYPHTYPYAYPTRGGRGARGGVGAVKRLDNRSRTIEVRNVAPGTKEDEELRTWLFQNSEFEDVRAGKEGESVVITFPQRYVAEEFVRSGVVVGGLGKLELRWVEGRQGGGGGGGGGQGHGQGDVVMEGDGGEARGGDVVQPATNGSNGSNRKERIVPNDAEERDVDYDAVADEDRWMAG